MQFPAAAFHTRLVPGLALCLSLWAPAALPANPVTADEESLQRGEMLYDLYCSGCHGINISGSFYDQDVSEPLELPYDFSELVDISQAENSVETMAIREEHDWPDWYDDSEPDPVDNTLAFRAEVVREITRVIDEAYGVDSATGLTLDEAELELPAPDVSAAEVFDPLPGVTNLADPGAYFYGTTEQDMFESIARGTGSSMPGWRIELGSDEAVWDIVNYIRSYWDEEWLY